MIATIFTNFIKVIIGIDHGVKVLVTFTHVTSNYLLDCRFILSRLTSKPLILAFQLPIE